MRRTPRSLAYVLVFLFVAATLAARRPVQENGSVTMLFAGDVTLASHIDREVGEGVGYIFERWGNIGTFDLFMVNLESAITLSDRKVDKEFNFRMHPRYLETLKAGGIKIVNLANNHSCDYGLKGLDDTIAYLDSAGILHVGAGRSLAEARTPVIIERKGKRIGFLGYHGSGSFAASSTRSGIAPRYEPYILEDVRALKGSVDFVVVNLHWGDESAEQPSAYQIRLAHNIVDAGADLIVGHHPHTLQGIERYKGATIAYSLGNFVFGGYGRSTYETAVLRVSLGNEEPGADLIPIQVTRWQPNLPDVPTRLAVLNKVRQRSRIFTESIPFSSGATQ